MRGQTLVLTAMSMLIISLMMMLSFNLSRAIHSRIALQQHSDATAFSTAVVQARTLNYLAYTNRAIAASLVAQTNLHATMAAASAAPELFRAGAISFGVLSAMEAFLCWLATPPPVGPGIASMAVHCPHIAQAAAVIPRMNREARTWRRRARQLDAPFRRAVQQLDAMMEHLYRSEQAMVTWTETFLVSGDISELRDKNAPQSTAVPMALRGINAQKFACTIDGAAYSSCTEPTLRQRNRSRILTNVANASRTSWGAARDPMYHFGPQVMQRLMNGVQRRGLTNLTGASGTAKIIDRNSRGQLHDGSRTREGRVVGADEHVSVFTYPFICMLAVGYGEASADIYTGQRGRGRHNHRSSHSGSHNGFQGSNRASGTGCLTQGNCFIRFRGDSRRDQDFGQPKVYAMGSTQLRLDKQGQGAAWEINDQGTVNFEHGDQGTGTLNLRSGEGAAVSKAMVYYHRLGDWREHPNMFNPFWRAKLHPFTPTEATMVLGAAGQGDAAQMAPFIPIY